jgi:hypothetical protein
MHSKCESVDVFQPTELWKKKVIMDKTYGKWRSIEFSRDRQELTCQL